MATQSKGAEMAKVTDIFGDTGEVIERNATPGEIAAQAELKDQFLAAEAVKEERSAAKAAFLGRLGITADEAALLLG
jgi:hypothetical protein